MTVDERFLERLKEELLREGQFQGDCLQAYLQMKLRNVQGKPRVVMSCHKD